MGFTTSSTTRVPVALIAAVTVALTVVSVWAPTLENLPFFVPPTTATLVGLAVAMWAFVGVGLSTWVRHRRSIVGPSLIGVGFGGLLYGTLWTIPTHTLALALPILLSPLLIQAVLAHPVGRLDRLDGIVVRGAYVATIVVSAVGLATLDPRGGPCGEGCTAPIFVIWDAPGVADVTDRIASGLGVATFLYGVVRVVTRWRSSSRPARRAMEPVMWALVPLLAFGLVWLQRLMGRSVGERLAGQTNVWAGAALGAIAVAFIVGDLRSRLGGGALRGLVSELQQGGRVGDLQALMRDRLHDPNLLLGFRNASDGYVGIDGRPLALDRVRTSQTTEVVVDDATAVVVHDPVVDQELVQTLGSAAALSFENEKLHAELLARLEDVRESRARIVSASDETRRRIGRNVHDGAQQRLVSLGVALKIIEDRAAEEVDNETLDLIAAARSEAALTVEELRDLSHGLYPALLVDAGIEAAVQRLVDTAPMVVSVDLPSARFSPDVDGCAYFVIAEAMANAAKHADADSLEVVGTVADGYLTVSVEDDGSGGASVQAGTGLRGLDDRVEAIGGRLDVKSDEQGTKVTAVIPCE